MNDYNVIMRIFSVLELPKEFDSKYLAPPTITFKLEEEPNTFSPRAVTLLCKVDLLHGVENWKNVTYQIEWYSQGELLQDPLPICQISNGNRRHDTACPARQTLVSELSYHPDKKYKAGMWVSNVKRLLELIFSRVKLMKCDLKIKLPVR